MTKNKLFNDPVYGFVRIPGDFLFELVEHPWFQRLRYIKQLGLTSLVYPGALHTRFHHAIGAVHLFHRAIENLRSRHVDVDEEDCQSAAAAVLLHDLGHGPFSHALEKYFLPGASHEELTLAFMHELEAEFGEPVSRAISIFNGTHPQAFLHQLVSSQLDVDRLDYLRRDSFYTGVIEGTVGSERLIQMMNVANNQIVIEEKGILSVEKFIMARRLMYWQVYLHKTVVSAEQLLLRILVRAKELAAQGVPLFCTPVFGKLLYPQANGIGGQTEKETLHTFARLDDSDILASIKAWTECEDRVLSSLCKRLLHRNLFRLQFFEQAPSPEDIDHLRHQVMAKEGLSYEEACYSVFTDTVANRAYVPEHFEINLLKKDGSTVPFTRAAGYSGLPSLTDNVERYFLCFPKELSPIAVA